MIVSPARIDFDQFEWIDLEQPTREDLEKLSKRYHFHQLNIEDCFSTIQVSKLDIHDDHSFMILRFPSLKESPVHNHGKPIDVDQLAAFIGMNYLVTVHKTGLKPISQLLQSYQSEGTATAKAPVDIKSPAHMLHKIMDGLVDQFLGNLIFIDQDLDTIEKQVSQADAQTRGNITDLRVEVATVARIVVPLRRVVMEVASDVKRFSKGESLTPYYSDIRDHLDKALEELQAAKDAVEIYKDTVYVAGTEKSNKILGLLTILFTLTIPVTVLSSFYGMNIEIPGTVQSGPWTFWGPYTTLIIVTIESIIPAVIMMWYFYHKKWTQI